MVKVFRVNAASVAIGLVALSLTAPAQAGNGSAVGAGLAGFGVGAILGTKPGETGTDRRAVPSLCRSG